MKLMSNDTKIRENTNDQLQQIAEEALENSVVCLEVEKETPLTPSRTSIIKIETTNGSGFFIDTHLVVTNFHVIVGVTSIKVGLSASDDLGKIESIEAFDAENDLILLKVNYEGVPLTIGDSNPLKAADEICTVGYPDSEEMVEHATIESTSGKLIQFTSTSSGGSSGSPILNSNGEVVGVKSASGVDVSGNVVCSYAIPSNTLKEFLHNRKESIPFDDWNELPEVRYLVAIDAAEKFQKDGDYKDAITYYDLAVELYPDKQETYEKRADAKMELGYLKESITDLITILRLKSVPFSLSNLKNSISYRWDMFKLYGIRFLLNLLVTVFGRRFWLTTNANSNMRKAKTDTEQGYHRDIEKYYRNAIYLFSEAINLEEKTGIIYNNRAWARYQLGQFEKEQGNIEESEYCFQYAIDDIDKAFKLMPKLSRVCAAFHHTRGVAKAARGDHQEAIEDLNESIRLRPKKALYYHDRGLSKKALEQHEEAELDFAMTKEIDPKFKSNPS